MSWLSEIGDAASRVLTFRLFTAAGAEFTPGKLLVIVLALVALVIGTGRLRTWIVDRSARSQRIEAGLAHAVATATRYVLLVVGIFIVAETAGIDLSTLLVLGGAVGVGIGLGLQSLVTSFVSGLILLIERSVKVGDRIEIDSAIGRVLSIGPRATTVLTNDNVSIIVPNSELVGSRVINWSHGDPDVRIRVPVGVSYGSSPRKVQELLLELARANADVLESPAPEVQLSGFGDSSVDFVLLVWTRSLVARPNRLRSDLYFAIWDSFAAHGISIPFPQRDVHVHMAPSPGSSSRPC